jgi:hypothetical protein
MLAVLGRTERVMIGLVGKIHEKWFAIAMEEDTVINDVSNALSILYPR